MESKIITLNIFQHTKAALKLLVYWYCNKLLKSWTIRKELFSICVVNWNEAIFLFFEKQAVIGLLKVIGVQKKYHSWRKLLESLLLILIHLVSVKFRILLYYKGNKKYNSLFFDTPNLIFLDLWYFYIRKVTFV